MKILVACEESQEVCRAFRLFGHEAFSCDIEPCSGEHEEWHIKQDVIPLLNGNCTFYTCDGIQHFIKGHWDMIIAFPPCTHLAISGARHFKEKRKDGRQREAIEFFCKILTADCERIAIENPVGIISGEYVLRYYSDLCSCYGLPLKPTQIVQPYMFGHSYTKKTCLWLKGLPELVPTKIVNPGVHDEYGFTYDAPLRYARDENGKILSWKDPRTAKIRSKTPRGLALAMAKQWGN